MVVIGVVVKPHVEPMGYRLVDCETQRPAFSMWLLSMVEDEERFSRDIVAQCCASCNTVQSKIKSMLRSIARDGSVM